jgi:hypothetical protein
MTTLPNGQILPPAPGLYTPPTQRIEGSALEAAATKTIAANAAQAKAFHDLGGGQKGGRRMRGGGPNATIPSLPEAGTIPGVSHAGVHLAGVDNLNQIRASAVGDSLSNAAPYTPRTGGKRTRRKANGRRNKRTRCRRDHKHTSNCRRSRGRVLRLTRKAK